MKKSLLIISLVIASGAKQSAISQTIAGGGNHSLALCSDSTVRAWGYGLYGELGNGTNISSNVPVQVSALSGITAIAGGTIHSLALENDGTVWAWGDNDSGQLGNGTNDSSNVPVQVSVLSGIIAIASAGYHCLTLKNDGTVWAWGENNVGQLGNGTTITDSNVPVQVSALSGITAVASGWYHSLALENDGTVWGWGANINGQLGNGSNTSSNVPVQVSALSDITAIAGGYTHSLALKNDGTVWAWGENSDGQLGNGTNTDCNVPVQVSALSGITAVAAGWNHSLAVKNDGTVWAWGENSDGQPSNIPVQVNALSGITAIEGGGAHSLALKNDGTLWAWGWNGAGQLGNGTNTTSYVPVQVTTLCQVSTGLEEENIFSTINLSPNPATSELRIENPEYSGLRIREIEIYNTLGEKRLTPTLSKGEGVRVDVSSLPAGVYFVAVMDNKGNKITKRFIKM